jgi:DNA (cytosine-5)-methyltransferase 1
MTDALANTQDPQGAAVPPVMVKDVAWQARAVDLFAGLGGFTAGATAAGARVVWAANHWPVAVQWHAVNHPETAHLCQDLHQADWTQVPDHDLLLASPACQGHTPARGKARPKGERSLRLAESPAVIAKNRYSMPDVVPLAWSEFSQHVPFFNR